MTRRRGNEESLAVHVRRGYLNEHVIVVGEVMADEGRGDFSGRSARPEGAQPAMETIWDPLTALRSSGGRPLILGHRGAAALAAENTLAAIAEARQAGADGIEIDVRATADGAIVLMHDATLDRLAGRSARVAELTEAELRDVRVGGQAIPTLPEALDEAEGMLVNVEVKAENREEGERLAARVARAVLARGQPGVWISSFAPRALVAAHHAAPGVPIGLLLDPGRAASKWRRLGRAVGAVAIHPHAALCDRGSVARWRNADLVVVAWTVDDAERLRELEGHGVDAVICDDPALALSVFRR